MRTRLRRATSALLALLATGALAAVLLAPATASANAAARTERAAARATRTAEREARREARQHERDERDERREAREQGKEPLTPTEPTTPPAEPAAPTSESPPSGCRPTLKASSSHVLAGETVTITGTLTCSTRASAAGQQVTISLDERGAGSGASAAPSALGPITTAADGSFEVVSPALEQTTVFHLRLGKRGARAVVKVAPAVTLSAPAAATLSAVAPVAAPAAGASETTGAPTPPAEPAAHGDTRSKVTFSGTVTPAEPGSRVALQVSYSTEGEHWRTVAFARVAADGSYAVAHRFRKAGQASVRVIAHMHGRNVNGVSPVLPYEVVQAQKPAPKSAAPVSQTPASPAS